MIGEIIVREVGGLDKAIDSVPWFFVKIIHYNKTGLGHEDMKKECDEEKKTTQLY